MVSQHRGNRSGLDSGCNEAFFTSLRRVFAKNRSMSSIKRDVKKKNFPTTGVEIVSRHPAHLGYASLRAAMAFHSHKIFPLSVTMRSSLGERQVTGVDLCQPWFYPRLMAYDYFWLSEEA
jgi:hypothetical protein